MTVNAGGKRSKPPVLFTIFEGRGRKTNLGQEYSEKRGYSNLVGVLGLYTCREGETIWRGAEKRGKRGGEN